MTTLSDIRAISPALRRERTGGGCTALLHPCEEDSHVLLTVGEGEAPDEDARLIDCGRYDAESTLLADIESIPIDALQAWIACALTARARRR